MKLYLITFSMSSPQRNDDMIKNIKEQGSWARITPNSWCIKSDVGTTAEIRDILARKLSVQSDERLMVVNMTNAAWASYYIPSDVANWLKEQ